MKTEKRCTACKNVLPIEKFHKDTRTNDGRITRCNTCMSKVTRIYNMKKKAKDPILYWAKNNIRSHKHSGYTVNLSIELLVGLANQTKHCSICDIELDYNSKYGERLKYNTPSLDRINNEPELNMNNVWIVCYECNASKRGRTMVELALWCEKFIEVWKTKFLVAQRK